MSKVLFAVLRRPSRGSWKLPLHQQSPNTRARLCAADVYVGMVGVMVTNPSQVKEERDRMKSEFESLSVTLRKVK